MQRDEQDARASHLALTKKGRATFMPHEHNSILVTYALLRGDSVRLGLRPMIAVRMHEAPVDHAVPQAPIVSAHHSWLDVSVGEGVPTTAPIQVRRPEITQGIASIVQNAVTFARHEVEIVTGMRRSRPER